ncbi:hypothetical protein BBO99_00006376 [Phytophthora kernoviae]|uniref:CCT domain-containing protein n=1 Tax=Phytophthora kernoviae TaxID=325452 RepID=A0A421GKU8_9STRA|nr:hypothetical protein JM16_008496 [Phytophthora kernoviae]KAG2512923.1 hypothetical protein JM18_008346 [Phytophthora kernoviae]RLN77893.1 hypothetical protein BBO99_00006376 [Phytophthora kernoviae]
MVLRSSSYVSTNVLRRGSLIIELSTELELTLLTIFSHGSSNCLPTLLALLSTGEATVLLLGVESYSWEAILSGGGGGGIAIVVSFVVLMRLFSDVEPKKNDRVRDRSLIVKVNTTTITTNNHPFRTKMIESEVAETLMSLSAPDERKFADNPLYASEPPSSWQTNKKRAFAAFDNGMASSLPSSSFLQPQTDRYSSSFSLLQHKIHGRPLTSMIPGREEGDSSSSSDVDMDSGDTSDDTAEYSSSWSAYRSPFDGLVAAARDQASSQNDNDSYSSSNSSPISIPMGASSNNKSNTMRYREPSSSFDRTYSSSYGKKHKTSSLSRVQENESFLGRDCSPTGVEEEGTWYDSDYKQRARFASVCSSDGSEYGGLGRQHLEEFIRMEISAVNEKEHHVEGSSPSSDGKYIGSYSPEARRKRIERFLEKRKRRVWAKKVDYDVRKNFANSRLRVKGRFVKKEDEELLCQLLSYT